MRRFHFSEIAATVNARIPPGNLAMKNAAAAAPVTTPERIRVKGRAAIP